MRLSMVDLIRRHHAPRSEHGVALGFSPRADVLRTKFRIGKQFRDAYHQARMAAEVFAQCSNGAATRRQGRFPTGEDLRRRVTKAEDALAMIAHRKNTRAFVIRQRVEQRLDHARLQTIEILHLIEQDMTVTPRQALRHFRSIQQRQRLSRNRAEAGDSGRS